MDIRLWLGDEEREELWEDLWFWYLVIFPDFTILDIRNSYAYRKSHIYETVKLNEIKLSNQLNYGERENKFKAFIEHDLDWTLVAQSYFLWQRATAWWAQ